MKWESEALFRVIGLCWFYFMWAVEKCGANFYTRFALSGEQVITTFIIQMYFYYTLFRSDNIFYHFVIIINNSFTNLILAA